MAPIFTDNAPKYRFSISAPRAVLRDSEGKPIPLTPTAPSVSERDFGRISVLLGANGIGKSRLLGGLASNPVINGQKLPCLYIEGGRAIDLNRIQQKVGAPAGMKLGERTQHLLTALAKDAEQIREKHAQKLYEWQKEGVVGPPPIHEDVPLETLFNEFAGFFPGMILSVSTDGRWNCRKGDHSYDIASLSDGEKQVLCLLCDIGLSSHPLILLTSRS